MPKRESKMTAERSRARYEMLTRSEHESWYAKRAHERKMLECAEAFLRERSPWDEIKPK